MNVVVTALGAAIGVLVLFAAMLGLLVLIGLEVHWLRRIWSGRGRR
jgi:hypothetical protein